MKKIILSHNNLNVIKESLDYLKINKLPNYVYKSVKSHNTSLGDCPSFPPSHDYDFDYKVLKKRYNEIIDEMETFGFPESIDESETILSKLMRIAVAKEKPIRPQLEKLVENVVIQLFAVPTETINLSCELKDRVECGQSLRIVPEDNSDDEDSYSFSDINEINKVDDIVKQRRFIDSLIQGYAIIASRYEDVYSDYFVSHGFADLLELYHKINVLNDYLTFVKEEKISKKNPSLISYVSVNLGHGDNKTSIKSQGLIFPYLLRETIRGFMELFSSHGLPKDNSKAQIIINRADYTMAEPWDIRFGKTLWELMFGSDKIDPTVIPYFFADFCSLDSGDFFKISQELLAKTKKGREYVENSVAYIKNDIDYQLFLNNIKQKNVDSSIITDGYLTSDDLDNYTIEEEGSIEENMENEYLDKSHGMFLKNYLNDDEIYSSYVSENLADFLNRYYYKLKDDDRLFLKKIADSDNYDEDEVIQYLDSQPYLRDLCISFFDQEECDSTKAAFSYNKDIYSNNQWLIHFTTCPFEIAKYGFTQGSSNVSDLACTHGEYSSKEGYNFAFVADNATNHEALYYLGRLDDNAGAVMFKADGVEAYHFGDEQNQVIFWGPSARNIIPIYHLNVEDSGVVDFSDDPDYEDDYFANRGDTDCWCVMGKNNRILYYHEQIEKIIDWVERNYYQYRNELICSNYPISKNDFYRPRKKNKNV